MIYPYQKAAVAELERTFLVHQLSRMHTLPVQPRTHKLLVGSTGCGKTFLARKIGKDLNWAVYHINVSAWTIMGARNEPTWPTLLKWISSQPEGRPIVIILDEIDKIDADDGWWRALRSEIFGLCDGVVPPGEYELECPGEVAEARLRNALVIGCGAFQSVHDKATMPSMGFVQDKNKEPEISHDKLASHLQRELVNRFGGVIKLPSPTAEDYRAMFDEIMKLAPDCVREEAEEVIPKFIPECVTHKLGARAVEVLLYKVYSNLSEEVPLNPWNKPKEPMVEETDLDDNDELWNEVVDPPDPVVEITTTAS